MKYKIEFKITGIIEVNDEKELKIKSWDSFSNEMNASIFEDDDGKVKHNGGEDFITRKKNRLGDKNGSNR